MKYFNCAFMCIKYFLKFTINERTLICSRAAKLYSIFSDSMFHICFRYGATLTLSFTPVHSTRSFSTAHDSTCTVNGTIKRISTFSGVHSLQDHRNIPHTTTDKSFLPRSCRCSTFTYDDIFFTEMCFFPSIVMVIVYFKC